MWEWLERLLHLAARINSHINWLVVAVVGAAVTLLLHMRFAERSRGSRFRSTDFYTDANGRGDNKALAYLATVFVCLLALVYQTTNDQLTEWFVTNVLGFVSAVAGFKSWVTASRDKAIAQINADSPPGVVKVTETNEKTTAITTADPGGK
jgi:hypothetical protein